MSLNPVLTIGRVAEATLSAKRFCIPGTDPDRQAAVPTGGTLALGVVRGAIGETFVAGKAIDVDVEGIVEVQATAAVINALSLVTCDNAGRVVAVGAGAVTQYVVGKALTAAGGTLDEVIEVQLIPGGALTVHA